MNQLEENRRVRNIHTLCMSRWSLTETRIQIVKVNIEKKTKISLIFCFFFLTGFNGKI
jgi:hypothetical protein